MALSRRRGTLEPMSTNGFNLRQSIGLPGRGMAARASLGPSTFDKAAKPQVRALLRSGTVCVCVCVRAGTAVRPSGSWLQQ